MALEHRVVIKLDNDRVLVPDGLRDHDDLRRCSDQHKRIKPEIYGWLYTNAGVAVDHWHISLYQKTKLVDLPGMRFQSYPRAFFFDFTHKHHALLFKLTFG